VTVKQPTCTPMVLGDWRWHCRWQYVLPLLGGGIP